MSFTEFYGKRGQSLSGMQAEVNGRGSAGDNIFKDPTLRALLKQRSADTGRDIQHLVSRGIKVSPYIEFGAGKGQRSLVVENKYNARGAATEINQGDLSDATSVAKLFNYPNMPLLICCDAQSMPFQNDTFRFAFCYETLHHFPEPGPVIAEVYRVLGKDGRFSFGEEPVGSPLRDVLRSNRRLLEPPTKLQRIATRLGIENIFWRGGLAEEANGIFEGYQYIEVWKEALHPFEKIDAIVGKRLKIKTDLRTNDINYLLAKWLGGQFRGLCLKTEGEEVKDGDLLGRLICLDCRSSAFDLKTFKAFQGSLHCLGCKRDYPVVDGVIRMLPEDLDEKLYPNNRS